MRQFIGGIELSMQALIFIMNAEFNEVTHASSKGQHMQSLTHIVKAVFWKTVKFLANRHIFPSLRLDIEC